MTTIYLKRTIKTNCNGTQSHNHLARKRTLNHIANLVVSSSPVAVSYVWYIPGNRLHQDVLFFGFSKIFKIRDTAKRIQIKDFQSKASSAFDLKHLRFLWNFNYFRLANKSLFSQTTNEKILIFFSLHLFNAYKNCVASSLALTERMWTTIL